MNTLTAVMKMNIDELRALKMVIDRLIESKIHGAIKELKMGDTVKINHKKVVGLNFTVVKVNRKKVRVRQVNSNTTYNVAASLIEKI